MFSKDKTIQNIILNVLIASILLLFCVSNRIDPFWALEKWNPQFIVLMLAASVFGFYSTLPSILSLFLSFLFYSIKIKGQNFNFMFQLNEFWFQQYGITFIVCLFGEFNFSANKTLKLKMSAEQHWNTIQQSAIQKLESSISALNWKLTVETQPVSQIFKFAKGLINAKPEYIAKFTLDLIQSRFGIQDTAFYILDKNRLNLLSARGRVKETWPNSIGANNISLFPYVKAAAENLKVISPGNMPIENVPPHIVLPILDDLGNFKGVLICDNISFMELTEHLILYLSELGLVCGSAILDNGKGESVARSIDLRPSVSMQYLNRDSFEIIKNQFVRLYGHKHSIGRVIEIGLQGIQNLHGRQNQILERLIISQVESRKDFLGVFTIDSSTLKMLFSDKVPSANIIIEELNLIFAQLGILDDISLEVKAQ